MGRPAFQSALASLLLLFAACGSTPAPAPMVTGIVPTSGPPAGGTAVTLSGANFQAGATVHFGAVAATAVTFNSAASLSAVTPAEAAGPVDVTVTNPDGQSGALPGGFTFVNTCLLPAQVTSNMTLAATCVWTAAATVQVGGPNSPVLTISPGTTVEFAPGTNGNNGAALRVGADGQPGSLVVNGTAAAGVTFTSAAATPAPGDWGGVVLGPQSLGTTLQYASIEFAGGEGASDLAATDAAALTVEGGDVLSGSATPSPAPVLSYVTVAHSAGHGFVFAGLDTGLAPASGYLSVNTWELSLHYPFVIEANTAGSLPTTISASPSTSATAVVALHSYVASSCFVDASTTWPAIPLPYFAVNSVQVISQGPTAASDTLTIAAPNTVQFLGTELDVDPPPAGSKLSNGNSYLVANGTATMPITFTSHAGNPSPGDWAGINFWCTNANQQSGSLLNDVTVEYASSSQGTLDGTGEVALGDGQETANGPLGPTISNSTFSNYGSTLYGITLFDVSNVSLNAYLSSNNSFSTANKVLQYCSGQITDGTCPQ